MSEIYAGKGVLNELLFVVLGIYLHARAYYLGWYVPQSLILLGGTPTKPAMVGYILIIAFFVQRRELIIRSIPFYYFYTNPFKHYFWTTYVT